MKKIMIAALLSVCFLWAAGSPGPTISRSFAMESTPESAIADIGRFPQNPFRYLTEQPNEPLIDPLVLEMEAEAFRDSFFDPWSRSRPAHDKDAVMWAWKAFAPGDPSLVGSNLRPPGEAWFASMREQARMDCYGTLNERAITVRETGLRNFPTEGPLFRDPSLPGEGFPFDYLQQTALKPGEPLFVSHLSQDEGWAFVESPQAAGWIDVRNMAFVDEGFVGKWLSRPLAAAVAEDIPLTSSGEGFLSRIGIGGLLPIERASGSVGVLSVLVPFRASGGKAEFVAVDVPHEKVVPFPLEYTPWNMARIMSKMEGEPYGWGGLFGNRDCSGTIRDLFIPFGLWVPRHSSDQAARGRRVALSDLSGAKKEEQIKRRGMPFRTLLWMPGHVMLYVGTFRGDIVLFHTFWGIRTIEGGREGRKVVGQAAFTSLEPGKELPEADPEGALLKRIESMTFLFAE
ncbi:MAG: SH3 domain-containing protein [Thermovirgaceae bacterium]